MIIGICALSANKQKDAQNDKAAICGLCFLCIALVGKKFLDRKLFPEGSSLGANQGLASRLPDKLRFAPFFGSASGWKLSS